MDRQAENRLRPIGEEDDGVPIEVVGREPRCVVVSITPNRRTWSIEFASCGRYSTGLDGEVDFRLLKLPELVGEQPQGLVFQGNPTTIVFQNPRL